MDSKRIVFNFNLKGAKGLKEIFYGKGTLPSFEVFFIIIVSLIIFLLPFIPIILKFLFLLASSLGIYTFFCKTAIEIIVEENTIQFRTYKKYIKFSIEKIRLIKVYYFSTKGSATIILKTEGKSNRYYLWAPRAGFWSYFYSEETARHELFLQLVETLKEKSKGRYEFKYKT